MVFKTVSRMIQSVNGTAISPGLFHFVEGSIGVCEDITPGIFTVRERNTDAQRHRRQVILRMLEQVIGTTDFAFYKLRHGTVHTGHHDHKLITADAAENINRTEAVLQDLCHPLQNPVTDGVAISVVNGFKVVNIDEDQSHVRGVHALHQQVIGTAVEQTGQCVVGRLM